MFEKELLTEARRAGRETERHRQSMLTAAQRRQDAIRALVREHGWTVRGLAAELGVGKAVVQAAVEKSEGRG